MKKYGCTAIKYLFSVILIVISSVATKDPRYVLPSLVELAVIFLLSNMLIGVKKYFQVLNDILLLLFNVETAILYFGNSYLSYIMLENTDSISALRGHAVEYIVAIILVLIFSFLPTNTVEIPRLKYKIILPAAIILEIILTFTIGVGYSPAGGMYDLGRQWRNQREMQKMIEVYASESNIEAEVEIDTQIELETEIKTEEKSDIETTTQTETEIEIKTETKTELETQTETETQQETSKSESKPETQSETNIDIETATKTDTETEEQTTLSGNSGDSASVAISEPVVQVSTRATRKQNVILIFTEGLSNHIITDSRNIMPNVAALKNQTISFSNYYNHTFATYRGIQM